MRNDIKKIVFGLAVCCMTWISAGAQSASKILNTTIERYNATGGVAADYSVENDQGATKGAITMQGNKFRILSDDLKCWYDGRTQWTYSVISGEVNITEPTIEEMQMSNPYIAITTLKESCKVYKAYTQIDGFYTLKLVPKADKRIKQILVYIHKDSYIISKVYFEMSDGNYIRTIISNYRAAKPSQDAFTYDSKAVPSGTEVVDLR